MIIGYLRVSTGKQNPGNQQDEIRRFAESRNWIVDNWVTEVASGSKREQDRKLGTLLRKMKRGDSADRNGNLAPEPDAHGCDGDHGQVPAKGDQSLHDQRGLHIRQQH